MSVLPVIDLGEEKACFFIIIGCQPTTPTHGLFMGSSLFCHDEASVEHFYEGAGAVERELSITCSFRQALFYLLSSVSFLFRLQPTGRRQTMLLSCKLKYIPKKIRREHGSTGGGGGNGPSPPPLVLGHFVKDFTKTVIFLNIRPPNHFLKKSRKRAPEKGRKMSFWAKKAKFSNNEKKGPREFPKL